MDFLIGLVGKDFVLVAADCSQTRSIIRMKSNLDKTMRLSDHALMLLAGPVGDCRHFGEYVQKNIKLNAMRNGYEASTHAVANFARGQLAGRLRTRERYQTDVLIAGCDETEGPALYWIDNLAAMTKIPYGTHGYGGAFTLATLDRHYYPDMSLEEAKDVLRKCIAEVRLRLLVSMPAFTVRVVDKDGIHDVVDVV